MFEEEGEMYNYGFMYMLFQGQITFHNFQLTYNILLYFFSKLKLIIIYCMTWIDVVKEDLRNMRVDSWREVVFDRDRWREVVLAVKTKDNYSCFAHLKLKLAIVIYILYILCNVNTYYI